MKDALNTALTYLSRRALTRFQLVQRLEKKGFNEEEIQECLTRLLEWGYLNDQEYARSYCLNKKTSYSKKRISYELKVRGIDRSIIEEILADSYPSEQEKELCRKYAQGLWAEETRRWEKTDQKKKGKIPKEYYLKHKVGQKLMQKGYPQEMIAQIVEELSNN